MEWIKVLAEILTNYGLGTGLALTGLVYQTWQRGKDRQSCESALSEARDRADQLNSRIQEWLMARVGE